MAVLGAAVTLTACGGDESSEPLPVVDEIPAALDAVEAEYDDAVPLEYFEVSATIDSVGVVVARPTDDDTEDEEATMSAESWRYTDGELSGPDVLGEGTGAVFERSALDVDDDAVFDQVVADLDSVIIDFAAVGTADGAAAYSVTALSDEGGKLNVQLAADGEVLATAAG